MVQIELTNRDIRTTGVYLMKWKNKTGLVRIVGQPRTGWMILKPNENSVEFLRTDLPEDGSIPGDALLSEPLALTAAPVVVA
jgi:hypothetical protein